MGILFPMRRHFRQISATIFGGILLAILAGVIGEFFIEWAREKGWYDSPSQTLDTVMTVLREFVTQTWFLCLASALGGLTAGLWLDRFLREREARLDKPLISARALAKSLDDLFAEGVRHRNALSTRSIKIETPKEYEDARGELKEWNEKLCQALDNELVPIKDFSYFRTLDKFKTSVSIGAKTSLLHQHIEQMWSEKVRRLREIIDRLGA